MAISTLTTIVVINFNYGRFLADAVSSAVGQTRRAHVLVIDDASTDESPVVLERLQARYPDIACHRLPDNRGLSRVRNLAAQLAATEWLLYLDADDWLTLEYVARAEQWLHTHTWVDVLTTDATLVRGERHRVARSIAPSFWNDLLHRNTVTHSSFIRRDLIRRVGGFDASLVFDDWDFWIRAMQSGARVDRLPGPHVFRREHGQNLSKACNEQLETAKVLNKHRPFA